MLNLEIESNWYFKKWELVSFSKTVKIVFYGGKKPVKLALNLDECSSVNLVIDSVKVSISTFLHERITFVLYSCGLGVG